MRHWPCCRQAALPNCHRCWIRLGSSKPLTRPATPLHERFQISVQRSCGLALLQRSTKYAKSHTRDQNALRQRIRDIALSRPRFGYRRVLVMLQREGWDVSKKRVYRLYGLEGLPP